jgi:hypothetical protein
MHAPFVQPTSVHAGAFALLAFAVQPASIHIGSFDHADGRAALRFHDPPLTFDSSAPLHLRI